MQLKKNQFHYMYKRVFSEFRAPFIVICNYITKTRTPYIAHNSPLNNVGVSQHSAAAVPTVYYYKIKIPK